MAVLVDVSADGVRAALSRERVREIVRAVLRSAKVRDALISVTFLSSRRIAAMNRTRLGHAGATDVISFGLAPDHAGAPVIGDIYVAPEVAGDNARAHGVTVREELTRLVVHGTLHVLGHEHPDGDGRTRSAMWKTQERLVVRLAGGGGGGGGGGRA